MSVLRTRLDAGKSLTGNDGEGTCSSGGDGGSDGVTGPSLRRQKGEGHWSSSNGAGVIATEDEAWY